jgi:hypothetical protein
MTCADSHNSVSVALSDGVGQRLGIPLTPLYLEGGEYGAGFEKVTIQFLKDAVALFSHLAPHALKIRLGAPISEYAQFAHLKEIQDAVEGNPELEAALGGEYLVEPDILIGFSPHADVDLSAHGAGLTALEGKFSFIRQREASLPILHASVSCKWTMRRDRAQNTRLEALNLVRNRKGRLPHIAAVTMECDPEILASLSLGTGDVDCVYHAALHELDDAVEQQAQKWPKARYGLSWPEKRDRLHRMVNASRLRDISDLPLDLLI